MLTSDRGILRRRLLRSRGVQGLLIASDDGRDQVRQVVQTFGLRRLVFYTRRSSWNSPLRPAVRQEVHKHVPSLVYRTRSDFQVCDPCGRYYWDGTYRERIEMELRNILSEQP